MRHFFSRGLMVQKRNAGGVSFWYRDIGGVPQSRLALKEDIRADICIIGAGYTGLWSAYYLKKREPNLRIVILESRFAGYGASGRNGGWMTGGFAWSHERYLQHASPRALRNLIQGLNTTVPEIIRVAKDEAIDADIYPTEEILFATNHAQWDRLKEEASVRQHWGENEQIRLLNRDQASKKVRFAGLVGGMEVANVARIQPAKLVLGLAKTVEQLGVKIYENSPVVRYESGCAETKNHRVVADVILRATEGYTASLEGHRKDLLPLNSAQIVTAPVPEEIWQEIGWQGHQIIGDYRHSYCYCQRTREGRITMGGRGNPYRFGSAFDKDGVPDQASIEGLIVRLHRYFPSLKHIPIDHVWCGVLGVPRDWCATVNFDAKTKVGYAGGYVGVGVSTSNLAGRTLADAVLCPDSVLLDTAWYNRPMQRWEPEPFRWLGVQGMYGLYGFADAEEERTGRPSRLAGIGNRMTGRT